MKTIWYVDKGHSEIGFKIRHMMISSVSGTFDSFEGSIQSNDQKFLNANFQFTVDTNSINTRNLDRDRHLKSEDFFHVEKYPIMTFASKSFDWNILVGDLTIKDITKEVALETYYNGTVVDSNGFDRAGFEISGEISRKDFNLTWGSITEAGNIVVADRVQLLINLEFILDNK